MPQDGERLQAKRYASFRSRFRAFLLDVLILAAVVVVSTSAMARFQESQSVNVGILVALAGLGLAYEPLMVTFCGGTLGHVWSNLRIVDSRTADRLPVGRALLRTLVKSAFGMLSFVFIFVTHQSQTLHDLAARSAVTIRNPASARARDYARPRVERPNRSMPSRARRVAVIAAYFLFLLIAIGWFHSIAVSQSCFADEVCSASETAITTVSSGLVMLALGVTILMGWTGRLPGCRAAKSA
jgi:uncharacterized RDD family membrane protein YckC